MKNEVKSFTIRDSFAFLVREDALFDCPTYEFVTINACSVIGAFDNDLIPLMKGVQPNRSLRCFSGGHALFRSFSAVIDGVAHEMRQRLGQCVENALIQVCLFAG